jgi:hypothetical protein
MRHTSAAAEIEPRRHDLHEQPQTARIERVDDYAVGEAFMERVVGQHASGQASPQTLAPIPAITSRRAIAAPVP